MRYAIGGASRTAAGWPLVGWGLCGRPKSTLWWPYNRDDSWKRSLGKLAFILFGSLHRFCVICVSTILGAVATSGRTYRWRPTWRACRSCCCRRPSSGSASSWCRRRRCWATCRSRRSSTRSSSPSPTRCAARPSFLCFVSFLGFLFSLSVQRDEQWAGFFSLSPSFKRDRQSRKSFTKKSF